MSNKDFAYLFVANLLGKTQPCGSRAIQPESINIATPKLDQETNEITLQLSIYLFSLMTRTCRNPPSSPTKFSNNPLVILF